MERSTLDLQHFFEEVPDMLGTIGSDDYFKRLNAVWKSVVGHTLEALLASPWVDFIHIEDRAQAVDALRQLDSRPGTAAFEVRYQCADGTYKLLSWHVKRSADSEFYYAVVREKAHAEELETQARLAAIVTSSDDAIIAKTLDGTITSWNPGAERMYGYSAEEAIGQPISIIFPPDAEDEEAEILDLLSRGERIDHYETERLRKDGTRLHISLTVSPVRDGTGKIIGAAAIGRDMTSRVKTQAEIQRLNAELEQRVAERTAQLVAVNKELEAFAYSVSHDLRAPLRAIDGFTQALLEDYDKVLDGEGKSFLRRVRRAAQRMEQLIDDLLKLSRLTRVAMRLERINLSELAREIAIELHEAEADREVELSIEPELIVEADPNLLRIALGNLLENAWKFTRYTPSPRIEVGSIEENGKQTYFVRDNGVGFNMAYAERLFGAFQRLHRSHEYEGAGIGLATVQRIINRHGGHIWAEAEVDQGATFYFTLQP